MDLAGDIVEVLVATKMYKSSRMTKHFSKRFIIVKILVAGAPPAASQPWLALSLTVGSIAVGCWKHYHLSFAAPPPQDGSNTGQRW
jgi:hypothetical protein